MVDRQKPKVNLHRTGCRAGSNNKIKSDQTLTKNYYSALAQEPEEMINFKRKSQTAGRSGNEVQQRHSGFAKSARRVGNVLEFTAVIEEKRGPLADGTKKVTRTNLGHALSSLQGSLKGVTGFHSAWIEQPNRDTRHIIFAFQAIANKSALQCAQDFFWTKPGGLTLPLTSSAFPPITEGTFKIKPTDSTQYHLSHWTSAAITGHDTTILEVAPLAAMSLPFTAHAVAEMVTAALPEEVYSTHVVLPMAIKPRLPLEIAVFSMLSISTAEQLVDTITEQHETMSEDQGSVASDSTYDEAVKFSHHLIAIKNPSVISLMELAGDEHFADLTPTPRYGNLPAVRSTFGMKAKYMREDLNLTGCTAAPSCRKRHRPDQCLSSGAIQLRVNKIHADAEHRAQRDRGDDTMQPLTHNKPTTKSSDTNTTKLIVNIKRVLLKLSGKLRNITPRPTRRFHMNIANTKYNDPPTDIPENVSPTQRTTSKNADAELKTEFIIQREHDGQLDDKPPAGNGRAPPTPPPEKKEDDDDDGESKKVTNRYKPLLPQNTTYLKILFKTKRGGTPTNVINTAPPYGLQHIDGPRACLSTAGIHNIMELQKKTNYTFTPTTEDLLIRSLNDLRPDLQTQGQFIPAGYLKSIISPSTKKSALIPLGQPGHYVALIIDQKEELITYFDSMGNPMRIDLLNALTKVFVYPVKDLLVHLQTDTCNCGIWILWFNNIWHNHNCEMESISTPHPFLDTLIAHMRSQKITDLNQSGATISTEIESNYNFITQYRKHLLALATTTVTHAPNRNEHTPTLRVHGTPNISTRRELTPENPKRTRVRATTKRETNNQDLQTKKYETNSPISPSPSQTANTPLTMSKLNNILNNGDKLNSIKPLLQETLIKQINNVAKGKTTAGPIVSLKTKNVCVITLRDNHWTCILLDHKNKMVIYFDPAGQPIYNDLDESLSNFFYLYDILCADIRLQENNSHTCGLWALWIKHTWEKYLSQSRDASSPADFIAYVSEIMNDQELKNLHEKDPNDQEANSRHASFIQHFHNTTNKKPASREHNAWSNTSAKSTKAVSKQCERTIKQLLKEGKIQATPNSTTDIPYLPNTTRPSTTRDENEIALMNNQFATLTKQKEYDRIVIAGTNMQGKTSHQTSLPGDMPKLQLLLQQISEGVIDVLCLSETKIELKHIESLRQLVRHYNLKHRMCWADNKASRGVLLIWNHKTLPLQVTKTYVDGTNKRAVSIVMKGGKGMTLTLSCGYMENANLPKDQQTNFYNFLSRGIPSHDNPKHMFIEIGDKNCALDPITQRRPTRETGRHQGEPNQNLLRFIQAHDLIEPIVESHPNTNIYTRTSANGRSKAKLDHILVNRAAHNAIAETGWVQHNPIIPSDHGIVWISLEKSKLHTIPQPPRNQQVDKNSTIRLKGANETTHDKYMGHPVRLITSNNTKTDNIKFTPLEIAKLLIHNGYHHSHFTHHTKCLSQAHQIMQEYTPLVDESTISKAVKWRNDKKEWWIHTAHEWVAHHMINKGRVTNDEDITLTPCTDDAAKSFDPNEWIIETRGRRLTPNTLTTHLCSKLTIPKQHITKITKLTKQCDLAPCRARKTAPPDGTAGRETPPTGRTKMMEENNRQDTTTPQVWKVTFQNKIQRNFCASYLLPWETNVDNLDSIFLEAPDFHHATGWTAYAHRVEQALMHLRDTEDVLTDPQRQLLKTYQQAGTFKSPGFTMHSSTEIWQTIKHIMQAAASKSFGHYTSHRPNPRTTLTSILYKWHTKLSKTMRHVKSSTQWNQQVILEVKKYIASIPIEMVQPHATDSRDTWIPRAEETIDIIKECYTNMRMHEIKENARITKRNMDAWFIYDIDRYLNSTIRLPDAHSGGLDWPTDSQGEIPLNPATRIELHKSVWEAKTETRKPPPHLDDKQWLPQLMDNPAHFTEQMQTKLTEEINMAELTEAYSRLKATAASGPSGIRNPQWKRAPECMQTLVLDLFNNIHDTAQIPQDMKDGIIYPIPKDPTKPCTSDNARPLTMLETGLKIFTQILSNRITKTLTQNPIYAPMQYAFLPGKSIMDPLKLVEYAQLHARKNNKEIHQTFLDLTQAFDRLEFWASDMALKRMNYPEKFTTLIDNLNTNSNRRIITKDGATTPWKLECGIAQGEVLSPIRFITVMDMLASWLATRANGFNPNNKIMGYDMSSSSNTRPTSSKHRLDQQSNRKSGLILNVLMYCDDISITTDSYEDMQDLLGVVSEFMTTFGIQINNKKSFYTMKSSDPVTHQTPITRSPTAYGTWLGGLNGKWIPEDLSTTPRVTIRQHNEPIRYLGVHYTLNGDWTHQLKLLKDTLLTCIARIRHRHLPQDQIAYLLNVVILPKLTYPLNVLNILTGTKGSNFTTEIDKIITNFAKQYLNLPRYTNHHFFYTNKKHLGIGLNSLEDEVNTNAITNTTITLNDWATNEFWQTKLTTHQSMTLHTPAITTTTHKIIMHQAYACDANLYAKTLQLSVHHATTSQNYTTSYLSAYHKGNLNKDEQANCLAYRLSKLGYAIKPADNPIEPHNNTTEINDRPGTPLLHKIAKPTYDGLCHILMRHGISNMNDFTNPAGTHLITWQEHCRWEKPNRTNTPGKPKWFTNLENEILRSQEDQELQNRLLKPQYIEPPRDIDLTHPFCYEQEGELLICEPLSHTEEALKAMIYVLRKRNTTWHTHKLRQRLILLESRKHAKHEGAIVPLEGIVDANQLRTRGGATILETTHNALVSQCKRQNYLNTIHTLLQEDTVGSMETNTDIDTTEMHPYPSKNTPTTNKKHPQAHMKVNSCSDGSVYHLPNTTLAGHAAVTILEGQRHVTRKNHPPHPEWTTPTAVLQYNPEPTESTEVEMAGLHASLPWFPDETDTEYIHALDNKAVIQQTSTPVPPKHTRHSLREYNHYMTSYVRAKLAQKHYYSDTEHCPKEYGLKITWIKGHIGHRLHDCADRHAARIAFRRTTDRCQRLNTERTADTKYTLHFYECLVSNDIRAHVKHVTKAAHQTKWAAKQSQGKIQRLIHASYGPTGIAQLKYAHENHSTKQQRFFNNMLNAITHTPHQEHKINKKRNNARCNLCGHEDADIDHIIHHCPHPSLERLRLKLEDRIIATIQPKPNLLTYQQQQDDRARQTLPGITLYPHSIDLHNERPVKIIEALPESRWYRRSRSMPNTVTIENPYMDNSSDEPKHQRITVDNFWMLIFWHEMTTSQPKPLSYYDRRAYDIWHAIKQARETSGSPSLCWATLRTLLDVLIDEIGCDTELFSNILNTYFRFRARRMLQANEPFAVNAAISVDGLHKSAYQGNTFGNPPFDGRVKGKNTITETLDQAEAACERPTPFRGTFLLPLSKQALSQRLEYEHVTLIMRFPNDSLPFIPNDYWFDKKMTTGCYNQKNTNLVILLYQNSKHTDSAFPVLNMDNLHRKLARWFICETPPRNHNANILSQTQIPLSHYEAAWAETFPEEWKFWKPLHTDMTALSDYPGAAIDLLGAGASEPFKDVINWDRRAAHMGISPPTFRHLIEVVSSSQEFSNAQVVKNISHLMRAHTYALFRRYWHIDRASLIEEQEDPDTNDSGATDASH